MLEYLFCILLCVIAYMAVQNNALVKHYNAYRAERQALEKRYNRLWKARTDLMGHFDWAVARKDEIAKIENIGREIERMDREMAQIREEVE